MILRRCSARTVRAHRGSAVLSPSFPSDRETVGSVFMTAYKRLSGSHDAPQQYEFVRKPSLRPSHRRRAMRGLRPEPSPRDSFPTPCKKIRRHVPASRIKLETRG